VQINQKFKPKSIISQYSEAELEKPDDDDLKKVVENNHNDERKNIKIYPPNNFSKSSESGPAHSQKETSECLG
jgi:hypothetical protein